MASKVVRLTSKSDGYHVSWLNKCLQKKVHALICTQENLLCQYSLYALVEVNSLNSMIFLKKTKNSKQKSYVELHIVVSLRTPFVFSMSDATSIDNCEADFILSTKNKKILLCNG